MKVESTKNRINLGDTRHLAMISLIASGGSPVICKELAGHEDINISSHYYSNISRFVECATYEMCRKQKHHHAEILESKPVLKSIAVETVEVKGGRCDSETYISGSINDCIRNVGTEESLGNVYLVNILLTEKVVSIFCFQMLAIEKNRLMRTANI